MRKVRSVVAAVGMLLLFAGFAVRVLADCSAFGLPFTDLDSTGFCGQIAEAYYTGLTNGTSATTYSPAANVTREQMAAFITRTLDKGLSRGNRRAALQQFFTQSPHFDIGLGLTSVGAFPLSIASDGSDAWVGANDGTVTRVRGSDGTVLDTWTTGQTGDCAVLAVMGKVFVSAGGTLYSIDPTHDHTTAPTLLAAAHQSRALAFDGSKIWSANDEAGVSIFTPGATTPWSVTSVQGGSPDPGQPPDNPNGIVFDGANIWVTDHGTQELEKLDASGTVIQSISLGSDPSALAFDGTNLWVTDQTANNVSVVRASTGVLLRTLTGNGLSSPRGIAFDGQRILVVSTTSVSLFQATSLEAIGTFSTGLSGGLQPASDGLNFWITFPAANKIGRY